MGKIPRHKLYGLYAAVAVLCAVVVGVPLYMQKYFSAGADDVYKGGAFITTVPLGGNTGTGSSSGGTSGKTGGTTGQTTTPGGQTTPGTTPSTGTTTGAVANKTYQQQLAAVGCYGGTIDGILGADSIAAITTYQKASNLTADGILGPATQSALSRDAAAQKKVCTQTASGKSTVFQKPVSNNAVTEKNGGWMSYYKNLLTTVGITLASTAIRALTGNNSVAAAVLEQATRAALLGYSSQQQTQDAIAAGYIASPTDAGPIDTGAASTATGGAGQLSNDIFTIPPDTGSGVTSTDGQTGGSVGTNTTGGGQDYNIPTDSGGTIASYGTGTGIAYNQYPASGKYLYENGNYQQSQQTDLMCFIGPALLPSATELVAKIPYVGDILNGLLPSFVAYKSYSSCGNYYGQYAYDPYTGQPTYQYNQPSYNPGGVQFSYEPVGGTMAIVARAPYENLKTNLLDLTGYIPVLGSPLAASLLFNN